MLVKKMPVKLQAERNISMRFAHFVETKQLKFTGIGTMLSA